MTNIREIAKQAGVSITTVSRVINNHRYVSEEIFHRYLSLAEKPSAFLVTNDQVAAGFVSEAHKHGIKVPQEIAVLSFDNHPIAEMLGISSIEIPTKEMGEKAFFVLFQLLNEEKIATTKWVIPYILYERGSI